MESEGFECVLEILPHSLSLSAAVNGCVFLREVVAAGATSDRVSCSPSSSGLPESPPSRQPGSVFSDAGEQVPISV